MVVTDTQATVEELLEVLFSMRPFRDYNEGQLPLEESLETSVRRARGLCDMAASLGVSWSSDYSRD
jgi:hypothetical protein